MVLIYYYIKYPNSVIPLIPNLLYQISQFCYTTYPILEKQKRFGSGTLFCTFRYFLYIRIVIETTHEYGKKIISFRHTDI